MKYVFRFLAMLHIIAICFITYLLAGTTGKIVGKVTDAESGEPLIGVNIIIEGTMMGAAGVWLWMARAARLAATSGRRWTSEARESGCSPTACGWRDGLAPAATATRTRSLVPG